MAKRGIRRSARFDQLVEWYPGVVEAYDLIKIRGVPKIHRVKLARGWRWDQPMALRPDEWRHLDSWANASGLVRAWKKIEPCDCDDCVGADRGDALHVWRQWGWLPDNMPMAQYLAYQLDAGHPNPPGLHVLSDETQVLVDVELEKMQRGAK